MRAAILQQMLDEQLTVEAAEPGDARHTGPTASNPYRTGQSERI